MLQTEFPFKLPLGYVDPDGNLHQEGVMRLATALDEIAPLKDARVRSNQAYLLMILLSRVIKKLGSVEHINPKMIEGLYAADLSYLQDLYCRINQNGTNRVQTQCPHCEKLFELELSDLGE
ncbi:MAG: phage tail assembly protein [Cyanobacteria bacterium CRU_2_1]|nr:phage tail assembly protein [Cyanobacteria bacterium RU_5_0]NJR57839.1 phage tail assembly protein [Cyanobacteria bacterium CRU_2_1]